MSRHVVLVLIVVLGVIACDRKQQSHSSAASATGVVLIKGPSGEDWIAGRNFALIKQPSTTRSETRSVRVVEFFWYECSHCYRLEPHVVLWNRLRKPPSVEFERVPATWRGSQLSHARLFYTLKELDRQDLDREVFDAIQRLGEPLYDSNNKRAFELQMAFAARHGIDGIDFRRVYYSAAVDGDLRRAADLAREYRVQIVPTLVVAGTYELDLGKTNGNEYQLFDIADSLVAQEIRLSQAGR